MEEKETSIAKIASEEQTSILRIKDSFRGLKLNECIRGVTIGYQPKKIFVLEVINELKNLHLLFGLEINPERLSVLASNIIKNYNHETFETIISILRNGASGKYKEKIYKTFTPQTFALWASEFLELLYTERERLIKNEKKESKPSFENRDQYIEAVKIGDLMQKEIEDKNKKTDKNEKDYRTFKAKYINGLTKKK